jgi:hypothetical protein
METLVDFVRFTKGFEYIIAIAALLLFIAFWRMVMPKPRTERKKRPADTAPAKVVNDSRKTKDY